MLANQSAHLPVQCVSLYDNSSSKVLLCPILNDSSRFPNLLTHPLLARASVRYNTPPNTLRLKLHGYPWSDHSREGSIQARKAVLDLITAMYKSGKELLVCADLTRYTEGSAGNLFFCQQQQFSRIPEFACISFNGNDIVRLVCVPAIEASTFPDVFMRGWKLGLKTSPSESGGCPEYQLKGKPWLASDDEVTFSQLLVLEILKRMRQNGWTKCVPFDCTSRDHDVDSLLFTKNEHSDNVRGSGTITDFQMCCIALAHNDKVRLIGVNDSQTPAVFESTVAKGWSRGIRRTSHSSNVFQIECKGQPWDSTSSPDSIEARSLICILLEEMHHIGWRLYCAPDLSRKRSAMSSFFFVMDDYSANDSPRTFGCVSLNDNHKMNLVRLPPDILSKLLNDLETACPWPYGVQSWFHRHDVKCATTVKFHRDPWNTFTKSKDKKGIADLLTSILSLVLDSGELVCAADVSAATCGEDDDPHDLNTFFFSFKTPDRVELQS